MNQKFIREIGLLNLDQYNKLKSSKIVLIGLGGVGGYTLEALVRSGIENCILIDKDKFEISNFNRQLGALNNYLEDYKVNVYKQRIKNINENINVFEKKEKITNCNVVDIFNWINNIYNDNYIVIDCIDDAQAKISIINYCYNHNISLISSMGTANHIKSENLCIDKLKSSKYCPLAKKIRTSSEINKNANPYILYFNEEPINIKNNNPTSNISTISYIPAIAGLKIAEFVIRKIIDL